MSLMRAICANFLPLIASLIYCSRVHKRNLRVVEQPATRRDTLSPLSIANRVEVMATSACALTYLPKTSKNILFATANVKTGKLLDWSAAMRVRVCEALKEGEYEIY